MLAPTRARSRTARTETPGPLGQTHQIVIVRLMVLCCGPVTASEASVVRLDSLGRAPKGRVDRSGGATADEAWSLELRASSRNRPGGRRTEPDRHTSRQIGRQIGRQTDGQEENLQGCCSCFALIFVVSPHLCASGNNEKNLAHPGTLARIAWASRVWHWLDIPYYRRGRGRYASV